MTRRRLRWRRSRGAVVPLEGDFMIMPPEQATCPAWPGTPHQEHVWAGGTRRFTCPGTFSPLEAEEERPPGWSEQPAVD